MKNDILTKLHCNFFSTFDDLILFQFMKITDLDIINVRNQQLDIIF